MERLKREQNIYVDKTDIVYELAQHHVCFLSRPRKFSKLLLISTLDYPNDEVRSCFAVLVANSNFRKYT